MRHHAAPVQNRPAPELSPIALVRNALDLGEVLAPDTEARVRHAHGEVAVVGEYHQAFGVEVEAPDREEALAELPAQHVEHGGATLGILGGGDDAVGLVEQEVAQRLRRLQPPAVHLHGVDGDVRLVAELCAATVHGHAPLANELLGLASRRDAGARDQFLDPLKGH